MSNIDDIIPFKIHSLITFDKKDEIINQNIDFIATKDTILFENNSLSFSNQKPAFQFTNTIPETSIKN